MHLLKHFKELTVRPKNAQELKSLILQLAVQGKLTNVWRKENSDVETASVLLKGIKAEKAQLIEERKIPKEKPFPKIDVKWVRYTLPKDWVWCNLGESIVLLSGRDLTPNEYSEKELKYPYLTGASQIKEGNIILSRWTDSPKVLSVLGDILISVKGTIGKTVINQVGEIHIARQIMALRTYNWIEKQFLKLFADSYLSNLQEASNGIIPGISREHLLYAEFPLPPLEEQKEIVEVVETLFKEVEQLEQLTVERITLKEKFVTSALNQLTTKNAKNEWAYLQEHFHSFFNETSNIKKLRETVLQLAVQGKLTADWRANNPDVEDATILLKRIQKEKAQLIKDKKIKKEKPLTPITKGEIPYELPDNWVWCRFQEVFDIRDGTHDSPKNVSGVNSYPLVTSKDFKNGIIDLENAKRISNEDYNKVIQRSLVEKDDILFSMIGGNLGNQVMVKGNTEFAIKNVALFKYYKKSLSVPDFLKTFSEHIAYAVQGKASGGAQPFVSLTFLRQMLIPLPPLEEQKAIVQKVNALMGLCDTLEQQVQQSQEQSEKLMQSCLREVFEGKKMEEVPD